jgi:hypothetical protein
LISSDSLLSLSVSLLYSRAFFSEQRR